MFVLKNILHINLTEYVKNRLTNCLVIANIIIMILLASVDTTLVLFSYSLSVRPLLQTITLFYLQLSLINFYTFLIIFFCLVAR